MASFYGFLADILYINTIHGFADKLQKDISHSDVHWNRFCGYLS